MEDIKEDIVEKEEIKADEDKPFINCDGLVRIYKSEGVEVMALQGLDLTIKKGELMAIIGKSGSGKSTLLSLLGGLDKPSAGTVSFGEDIISEMDEKSLARYRNEHIGFVWQKITDNLLMYLTAAENVEMPLLYTKMSKKEKRQRAESLLDAVGLSDKYDAYPSMLSGGEQQRVAIATALANEPELLLMDEPTGAVDKNTSLMLQALFRKLNRELGITVIIVTHDLSLADQVDRVVMIADGKISSERILKEKYQETITGGAGFNENAEDPDKKDADEKDKKEEKEETHDEYLVLDKAGRVRLSEEVRKAAGIEGNRVNIDVVDGKIIISS